MIIKRQLRQSTIHNEMLRVHTWLLQLKFASLDLEKHKAESIALFISPSQLKLKSLREHHNLQQLKLGVGSLREYQTNNGDLLPYKK